MATVTVRGHAVVPGQPDEVGLTLAVSALAATPEEALTEAAERSRRLEAILDELEVPRASRTTTGLSVSEEREYERERWRHKGYRASNRVQVRLDQAAIVGRLLQEAIARAEAAIDGPEWRIAIDNPARTEACRQAAADARRRAEAYAEALGLHLGEVLRVSEPGIGVIRAERHAVAALAAGPAPEITVEAGEMEVAAAIDVTFRLE